MRRTKPAITIAIALTSTAVGGASTSAARLPGESVVAIDAARRRMALLTPGTRRYVRYTIKDGERATTDIWTRVVSFEGRGTSRRLHITQRWDRVVPPASTLEQDAWFDPVTFAPATHVRRVVRDGVTTVAGYRFGPNGVVGMSDLSANSKKEFALATRERPFNFEYDMELLQTLPWHRGYVADIVFYDPGLAPPAHYRFRQAGEVRLMGAGSRPVDCWLVTADYNTGQIRSRFWIDKRTQVVLHEESEFDGVAYVKTLLASESRDSPMWHQPHHRG